MNQVQFRPGLSLAEFQSRYGTEAQCEQAVAQARWPKGFSCQRCQGSSHSVFERQARTYWQCRQCRYQVSAISGTIFQASKLPLTQWFLAMHLLTQSKNNLSALALMRHLGVSYRTAWALKHKLLQVMAVKENNRILEGQVEISTSCLDTKPAPKGESQSSRKAPFIIALQRGEAERPPLVRLAALPCSAQALLDWSAGAVSRNARVSLKGSLDSRKPGRAVGQFSRSNGFAANLRMAIAGTYHSVDFAKYASRYLAESAYRFNRRFEMQSILSGFIADAAGTRPHPECRLRFA